MQVGSVGTFVEALALVPSRAVEGTLKAISASFSSQGDTMPEVLQFVDQVERDFQVPAEILTDLRIALDEVVTNIVSYAYSDNGRHEFTIRFELGGDCLETIIEDDGMAFDPLGLPPPELAVPMEERRVGGLGWHFVKNLMDSVDYERVEGRNRLTLKQNLEREKGKA
jgi:serine/threonine-protein kinase RsbW